MLYYISVFNGDSILIPSKKCLVIKLTGKIFDEKDLLVKYVQIFREIVERYRLAIITGGGKLARTYIGLAKELGVNNNYWLDQIGTYSSRLNSLLLISALQPYTCPEPIRNLEDVIRNIREYEIVVLGGLIPGQSTAAVAIEVAEAIGANNLINVAAVDHVYNRDPRKYRDAKKYKEINASELIRILEQKPLPGEYALVDRKALELAIRSNIVIHLMYYKKPEDVFAILNGENPGTIIYPR